MTGRDFSGGNCLRPLRLIYRRCTVRGWQDPGIKYTRDKLATVSYTPWNIYLSGYRVNSINW